MLTFRREYRVSLAMNFLSYLSEPAGATVPFEHFIIKDAKRMRLGFTTGACAALAAGAATTMLLSGRKCASHSLVTPKGIAVEVEILAAEVTENSARCAVAKDAGDDPDITGGVRVFAQATRISGHAVIIDGGDGVGKVTRPGLATPVGEAAINPVPRRMIEEEVRKACAAHGCTSGVRIEISIPGGEALAAKTFNPALGIVGGLSIIGTSGIVEPMSTQAVIDTMAAEMRMRQAEGAKNVLVVPGNYGDRFRQAYPVLALIEPVKCANFIGEALDLAIANRFRRFLIVGHIGKMIKVAGGIMNTHSRFADCRLELLALHTAVAGGCQNLVQTVLAAATVDAGLDILGQNSLLAPVLATIMEQIGRHLRQRAGDAMAVGAVVFSNRRGLLGYAGEAKAIIEEMEKSNV